MTDQLTPEEILETPMIEIMHHVLLQEKKPLSFYALMQRIGELKNMPNEEVKERLAQVYTDINIDGRFVTLGDNQWGLKSWYPVEQSQEELATTIKPKKQRKKDEDADELGLYDDLDDDFEDLDEDVEFDEVDDEDFAADDADLDFDADEDFDEDDDEDEDFAEDEYDLEDED
ncbi:DNA-directed RNA polymerase subunit delta [Pseudalkalibacillus caeni]|uniref:Probable DNA-directed RNA polymerase subunit delta n=1 Tax=Exobacillus caeni TaxID=2574798 RepID=A0A5R9F2I2_9BACL|nr:DNA-directed RNA polymerase subunit delta [Pseudalkalibacillus caeni]TLS36739.1 DNA-directed RNA polymerase subunit delta [Pseudalkalibacillus caeni]